MEVVNATSTIIEPVFMAELAEESGGSPFVGFLWFLVIALMFFAQHHTCDAYFVPAINVFCADMRKSSNPWLVRWGEEAVAGATICALGCNGPELFSNLISLYTHSDAGIGVVVGSEIFNLLVIIGASTLAAPRLPLELERVPFTRDCAFYFISIILLYWALLDKKIDVKEAFILLAAAGVYVMAVYFTTDIANKLFGEKDEGDGPPASLESGASKGKMHGVEVMVEEILHSRMVDGHHQDTKRLEMDPTAAGLYTRDLDGPMEDAKKPSMSKALRTSQSLAMQIEKDGAFIEGAMFKYSDLKEVAVLSEGVIELEFEPSAFQHVSLKLTCGSTEDRDKLLKNIEEYSLGRTWVHKYDATVFGAIAHLKHTITDPQYGPMAKLLALPEFLIDFCLKATLSTVDVKSITKEDRWPMCFIGAMCWLAFFSYVMLEVANQIHYNIPVLTNAFLGITVCAVGTSFPNAVASVIMSSQNKPAAAIANALGSNVQNVFLAMALPWVIYICQGAVSDWMATGKWNFQPIQQDVAGISEGVAWMMGTLVLVLVFVVTPIFCTLNKVAGGILMMVYLVYVVITSGEAFGWWPPLLPA
eukprot:gnl/TRDRNA2_/TRDRNA2_38686_c0_seq1.p1 gnl/TRDRNA2_/TRDRNA2_38686_c0~~gnl/TRDRNA2_/TRDRNA2_38686_c0_seq1.p1  ORF type:complete len:613 (-),score=135.78 gnl/TRDRNA2_/TRDRNA2_38686_c0_seq1:79-1842(-)